MQYEAKEPASITAVSLSTIAAEVFDRSALWHKIEHLLFVFYQYESETTVPAAVYATFHVRGFRFYSFENEDLSIIRSDWQKVHDFVEQTQSRYGLVKAKEFYPLLSTELNYQLVYLDTAPKYPHPPRFRLRRRVVTMIIQQTFNGLAFEKIPGHYSSYDDVVRKCQAVEDAYGNRSIRSLLDEFGIRYSNSSGVKNIAELVAVRFFGGHKKHMAEVDLFVKFGFIGKTITLTSEGKRTEDMKLCTVDFDDLQEEYVIDEETGNKRVKVFEDSNLYDYFNDTKLLCVKFTEHPGIDGTVDKLDSTFSGFEIIYLSSFLEDARKTWNEARNTILSGELASTPLRNRDGSIRYTPKTHLPVETVNLPKSNANTVFMRGSGTDAKDKVMINGVRMLKQWYWIKGSSIVDKMS